MYFKIFNEADNHHGFQYNDGLNTDVNEVDPNPENSCVAGGLYFSDENNICEFSSYGSYIRHVNKFRRTYLGLRLKKPLNDVTTWQGLIDDKVNIKAKDNYAIQWTSANGHTAIVELLLKHGAKLP